MTQRPARADYAPCHCDEALAEGHDECGGCQEYGAAMAEWAAGVADRIEEQRQAAAAARRRRAGWDSRPVRGDYDDCSCPDNGDSCAPCKAWHRDRDRWDAERECA